MEIELPEEYADWVPLPMEERLGKRRLHVMVTEFPADGFGTSRDLVNQFFQPSSRPKIPEGLKPGAVITYTNALGGRTRLMLGCDGYWFDEHSRYTVEAVERYCVSAGFTVLLDGTDG